MATKKSKAKTEVEAGAEDTGLTKETTETSSKDDNTEYKVFQIQIDDDTYFQKRFKEGKEPKAVVVCQRLSGEPHVLAWTTSVKTAEAHAKRVQSTYIAKGERYKKVAILPEEKIDFIRVMKKGDAPIPPEFKEDRSCVKDFKREERYQALIKEGKTEEEAQEIIRLTIDLKREKAEEKKTRAKKKAENPDGEFFASKKKALRIAEERGLAEDHVQKTPNGWYVMSQEEGVKSA